MSTSCFSLRTVSSHSWQLAPSVWGKHVTIMIMYPRYLNIVSVTRHHLKSGGMSIDPLGKFNIHKGSWVLRISVIHNQKFPILFLLLSHMLSLRNYFLCQHKGGQNGTYKHLRFSHAKTFTSRHLGGKTCSEYTNAVTVIFLELIVLEHKPLPMAAGLKPAALFLWWEGLHVHF